jgi:3-methyladenine DNA glycosylase AlkD
MGGGMPKSVSAAAPARKCRALFNEIRAACEAHADPARAAKYARYFVEGYDAYGIDFKSAAWRQLLNAWLEKHRAAGLAFFLELGDLLVRTGKYEEASVAIVLVSKLREEYTPDAFAHLGTWFHGGIRNWAHNDVLCGEVLQDFLIRAVVPLDALSEWRASEHKYRRRAVPVMMLGLLDKTADYRPPLGVIRPMMLDAEKVVQQGLGWFLREAWKRNPRVVEPFLLEYKNTAPRLIFQYATEKMTPAQKNRFRRDATGSSRRA